MLFKSIVSILACLAVVAVALPQQSRQSAPSTNIGELQPAVGQSAIGKQVNNDVSAKSKADGNSGETGVANGDTTKGDGLVNNVKVLNGLLANGVLTDPNVLAANSGNDGNIKVQEEGKDGGRRN